MPYSDSVWDITPLIKSCRDYAFREGNDCVRKSASSSSLDSGRHAGIGM